MIDKLINDLIDVVDGELTSRSRVVDGLLDLRNAAESRSDVVSRIDELLADLPGLTTVPNGWWLDRLGELKSMVEMPLSSV